MTTWNWICPAAPRGFVKSRLFIGQNNDPKNIGLDRFKDTRYSVDRFSFRLEEVDSTARDCFYCWREFEQSERDFYQHPVAIISEYYHCSFDQNIIQKIQDWKNNVTLPCWDTKIEENVTVEWYFQGIGKPRQLLTAKASPTPETLILSNVSKSDIGNYTCYIFFKESKFGHKRTFQLRLFLPPLKPTDLQINNITDTRAILNWRPVSRSTLEAKPEIENKFKIHYYEPQNPNSDKSITVIDQTMIAVTNLTPCTFYVAEVSQVNAYGESDPIRQVFLTRNSSNVNTSFDLEVKAIQNRSVALACYNHKNPNISWTKIKEINKDYERYYGHYNHHYRSYRFRNDRRQLSRNSSQYLIKNFQESDCGLYECQAQYEGTDQAHILIVRLAMLIPPSAPSNLQCINEFGNGSLTLIWKNQNDDHLKLGDGALDNFRDNTIEKYKIKYRKIGGYIDWKELVIDGKKDEIELKNLASNSRYIVRLIAMNEAGVNALQWIACAVS